MKHLSPHLNCYISTRNSAFKTFKACVKSQGRRGSTVAISTPPSLINDNTETTSANISLIEGGVSPIPFAPLDLLSLNPELFDRSLFGNISGVTTPIPLTPQDLSLFPYNCELDSLFEACTQGTMPFMQTSDNPFFVNTNLAEFMYQPLSFDLHSTIFPLQGMPFQQQQQQQVNPMDFLGVAYSSPVPEILDSFTASPNLSAIGFEDAAFNTLLQKQSPLLLPQSADTANGVDNLSMADFMLPPSKFAV
ncbi:UNVERIFIED_CONTAM: hypothetical protein HDU68_009142 [Siphonaria sp. JEL0065]|nr:hypothetical protein HDU68_009142 [Siphonaria sp. JEL0065]